MSIIGNSESLSQLNETELDHVFGGHPEHTFEAECELDDNGNGKCKFKSD